MIWEHFGMTYNTAYEESRGWKLSLYARNGFLPNKNLIVTAESGQHPVEVATISGIIEAFVI